MTQKESFMPFRKKMRPMTPVNATVVVPVTKAPHPEGRRGPMELQDWHMALLKAIAIAKKLNAGILILSALKIEGQKSEADAYRDALLAQGLAECADWSEMLGKDAGGRFIVIRRCVETIGQMKAIGAFADRLKFKTVFVSTKLHYLRVRWLTLGFWAEHVCSFRGRSRRREAVTDIVLTFALPILDLFRLRRWFQYRIICRRINGAF